MSEKMTLVTAKANGHVLGAVTRAGDPDRELAPQDLAGEDGLMLRDPATGAPRFAVEAGQLQVETTDRLDDVFFRPSAYAIVAGALALQTSLDPPNTAVFNISFGKDKLIVTAQPPFAPGDKVWAQIESPQLGHRSVHEKAAVLDRTGPDAKAEIYYSTLAAGTYHLLVLVPGYQSYLETKTFP